MFKIFKATINDFSKAFTRNGFTATKCGDDSILVEGHGKIGGFTIYGDTVMGALCSASLKEDLMGRYHFSQEREDNPMTLGGIFYWSAQWKNAGGQRLSIQQIKDMAQGFAACA